MQSKRTIVGVLLGVLAACALGASPALAVEQPTVEIQGAELVAKGTAVLVTVDVTCGPFESPSYQQILDVRVSQRSGNKIVNGGGSTTIVCDGQTHTYEVTATPFNPPASSGRPFKHGTALVTASTNIYNNGMFYNVSDQESVKIS